MIGLIGFRNDNPSTKFGYEWVEEEVNGYESTRVEFSSAMDIYEFNYFYLIKIICTG